MLHSNHSAAKNLLCLAISIVVGATAQQASAVGSCSIPVAGSDLTSQGLSETDPLYVHGINPLISNRVTTNLYTDSNGEVERVRGGDYAATTLDVNLHMQWRDKPSEVDNASTVNALVKKLNNANGGGNDYVAGHMVYGKAGGNTADRAGFTALTRRTNKAMENHGEDVAKFVMEKIITQYETSRGWVATNGTKKYKPGILYETDIIDDRSIADYEVQHGAGSLIPNPLIKTNLKKQMAARVRTRITFIMHEYKPAWQSSRAPLQPTKKWFYMPQSVFDARTTPNGQTVGERLLQHKLPTSGVVNDIVEVSVTGNGREITWQYWNRE